MSSVRLLSRREWLRGAVMVAAGGALAACAPQVVEKVVEKEVTKVVKELVKETVVVEGTPQTVEKVVEKVVKETVVVEKAPVMPVELQFWTWPWGLGEEWPAGKLETQYCEEYTALHPEVTFQFQVMGWDAYDKVLMGLSAGNPPNLMGRSWGTYVIKSMEANCSMEIELEQELVDDLDPVYYESLKYMGKIYYVPVFVDSTCYSINLNIAKEAKAEDLLPKAPERAWDFDQYLEFMKATTFKRADGKQVWGYALGTALATPAHLYPEETLMMNWPTDQIEYKDGQWRCKLGDPDGIAFMQWLYDLYAKEKVMANPAGVSGTIKGELWQAGQISSWLGGNIVSASYATTTVDPETLVVTDTQAGFDWIFVQVPKSPSVKNSWNWGGPKGPNNTQPLRTRDRLAIQPSVDFAHFFSNVEHQKWLVNHAVPVRQSAFQGVTDPLLLWLNQYILPFGRMRSGVEAAREIEVLKPLELCMQKVFTGVPIEEAVAGFCKDMDTIEWPRL